VPLTSNLEESSGVSMAISVSEPEKHGEGVKAFVSYKVTSKTTHPDFPPEEIYVRRRFNDFQWLRNQLTEQYPELLVPPLPQRTPTKFLQRFEDFFLEKRRRALELFIQRIASHPKLSVSNDFLTFLHAKDWALKTAQENDDSKGISGIFKKMNLTWTTTSPENDADFEKMANLKNYLENFQSQLTSINNLLSKSHSTGKEFGGGLVEVGPAFYLLAQLENELTEGLTRTGHVISEDTGKGLIEQIEYEDQYIGETLNEYILMAQAATDVLNHRDTKVALVTQTTSQLALQREELEKAKAQAATPEENKSTFLKWREKMSDSSSKIKTLEERIIESEKLLEERKQDLRKTTAILIDEMEKFHVWKLRDFKTMLLEYISYQIEFHKKAQASWEGLLPVVQGINKPSKRSTWWVGNK